MIVTVDVPDEIAHDLGTDEASRSRKVLEELLLRKYIAGEISGGLLGKALGMGFYEREQFLHDKQAFQNISPEEFARDLEAIQQWLAD